MAVSKKLCNLLRNRLKETKSDILSNNKSLTGIKNCLPQAAILGQILCESFKGPEVEEAQKGVGNVLTSQCLSNEMIIACLNSIIESLSTEGFRKVTYRLPLYCISLFGAEPEYSYLLLSGIKLNSKEKKDADELMDDTERKLWEFEKQMGMLIEEDMNVKIENIEPFLECFANYLGDFYDWAKLDLNLDSDFDIEKVYNSMIAVLAWYIFLGNTGKKFDKDNFANFYQLYIDEVYYGERPRVEAAVYFIETMYEYYLEEQAFKNGMRRALDGKPATNVNSKQGINYIRGQIKEVISYNEKRKHQTLEAKDYHIRGEFALMSDEEIREKFSTLADIMVQKGTSSEEIIKLMDNTADGCDKVIRGFQELASNISSKPIEKVTYNLPYICLLTFDHTDENYYFECIRLILSGIKVNAREKKDYTLYGGESYEEELHDYEKKLAPMISDDFKIDRTNITGFVNIFMIYIDTFFTKCNLGSQVGYNYNQNRFYILVALASYAIYSNCGYRPQGKAWKTIERKIEYYLGQEGPTFGGAVNLVFNKYVLPEYEEAIKDINAQRTAKEDSVEETVEETNLLVDYIANGKVVKVCGEEEFARILEEAGISTERAYEYKSQMRNLRKRQEQEEFARRMDLCKDSVFDPDERELYENCRSNPDCATIISVIDSILEEFMTASDEDRLFYFDEIGNCLNELREMINVKSGGEDGPKEETVRYFVGDDVQPVVLKSALKDKKCNRKQVVAAINKLVEGVVTGDKEIFAANLPCRLYRKGKGTYVFYTILADNTVLIIDTGFDDDGIKRAIKTVTSQEFVSYLSSIQNGVTEEQGASKTDFTSLIIESLAGRGKVKIKK